MHELAVQADSMNRRHKLATWIDRSLLFSLAVYAFILPIGHIITVREIAFYLSLALLLVRLFLNRDIKWISTSFELPFAAFALVSLASIPFSSNVNYSLRQFLSQVLVPIGTFYMVYYAIRKERDALLFIGVIIFANLIFGIIGMCEFVVNDGSLFSAKYRVYGIKEAIEANGLYQAMISPFLLIGIFHFKKNWQKAGAVLLLLLNLFVLYVTFTRAAYLALAAELMMLSILFLFKKRWIHGSILLIAIFLSIIVLLEAKLFRETQTMKIPSFNQLTDYNRSELASLATTSTGERLVLWKIAADEIIEHPFYPKGLGRFNFHNIIIRRHYEDVINFYHVHNTFLSMALELGIQGFLVFMWMIITFFVVFWTAWGKSSGGIPEYLAASAIVMMSGYWVDNFFQNHDVDDIKLLFMIMIAVGMAVLNRLPKQSSSEGF